MLEGKVAIVTGAGRGLGKAEALELAKHGARVVVNDLGSGNDGSGAAEEPAREVVAEIEALGGEAIAHFGDVASWSDAEALVQRAVDHFGSLDILVNNAGFVRDRVIFNMSEEEFDSVVRVHLKGHFCTMRFATAYWREKSKAAGGAGVWTSHQHRLGGGALLLALPAQLRRRQVRHRGHDGGRGPVLPEVRGHPPTSSCLAPAPA